MNTDTLHDLIPAYALGALDPAEVAAVEALLASDENARARLAEYEQVAEALLFAVPAVAPPPGLAQDFRDRLAASRTVELPAASRHPAAAVIGTAAPAAPSAPGPPRARLLTPHRLRRLVLPLVAALAILFGVLIALVNTQPTVDDAEQLYYAIEAAGVEARVDLAPGAGQTLLVGDMIVAAQGCEAVLRIEALPLLGPDETYQLWLRGVDGSVESGGLFRPDADHATFLIVPVAEGALVEYAAIGASREPAGGSPYTDQPSGPSLFLVEVPREDLPEYEGEF